jgi:D-glycero-beta-D-manno-heptose-7-phosphate kinase
MQSAATHIDFSELFDEVTKLKVAVVGDIMLDTYWWGSVDRISPEAPVPIVALNKREQRIGGAGNVALNIRSLGADVAIISVFGDDADGDQLKKLLDAEAIDTSFLVHSHNRLTTNKVRIMSRNQQMMRLDAEMTTDLLQEDELRLIESVSNYIAAMSPDVLIFEDYNKGVLTARVIEELITLCKDNGIVTTVDPKRRNFFSYAGVDIFKPNLREAKDGLNIIADEGTLPALDEIHHRLKERLGHKVSLITLSEHGVFYNSGEESRIIPSHLRNIADVSGAGDTVIAVASLIYAATKDVHLMAEIANIAGGLVCEEVGTAAISRDKLMTECDLLINQHQPDHPYRNA